MAHNKTLPPGAYLTREQEKVTATTEVATIVWGCLAQEDCPVGTDEVIEVYSFKNFKDTFKLTDEQLKTSKLALAVYEFYLLNSGSIFILNMSNSGGKVAEGELTTGKKIKAKSAGTWGNGVKVEVASDSVTVTYNGESEVFTKDVALINANSKFVTLDGVTNSDLSATKTVTLSGGTYTAITKEVEKATLKAKLELLLAEDSITIVTATIEGLGEKLTACTTELQKELDLKVLAIGSITYEEGKAIANSGDTSRFDEIGYRGAILSPRPKVLNPFTGEINVVGCEIVAPATFAKMINNYGIAQAPAGVEAVLPNVVGVEQVYTVREQGILNSLNINCIVPKRKYGVVIWGNRLINVDDDRMYISDLLLDDYIDNWIQADTETFSFKNADKTMYTQITARLTAFFRELWDKGYLAGDTVEEAYVVKCDENTNVDAEKGEVFAEVGWAKKYPAEFIFTKVRYINK